MPEVSAKTKPGYRTTEFWMVGVPGLILTIFEFLAGSGLNFGSWAGPIMGGLYAISRGLSKATN